MIRILHSVSNMDRAGIETMLMNYYRYMDKSKVQFDFLCNKKKPGAYDDEIKSMGGRIYHTPGLNPAKYPVYLKYMRELFQEHPEYKIVEAHNGALGVYALHAAKVSKIPVRIFHAHGASITKDWKLPIKLVCKACLPTNMTHHFSCGVEAAKCYFGQKVVDENDYVLIPNAIDVERFIYNPEIRNKIRKENDLENKHVVGHVGRFMAQKNHTLFVWNQILDCAKSKQKDFIFVTNDVKIDWYEEDKRTPRFELLKEFREQANKRIWLLSMKNFIYHVNLLLDDQIHENVLQDIDSVQDEKENDKIRKELSADDIQKIFNNLIVKPIYVIDKIPKNESIRLFDNPDIYEAEDENGRKFRIITTIVGGGNYARVLHGMTNAFELKKLYETGNEHYWYYNFIIAKNEALVEKVMEHMGKTKVRKLFADHSIQTAVCYLNEDQNINIAKANFDI